jgi:3'(2'), 5'-bisphosphate nucleotidase
MKYEFYMLPALEASVAAGQAILDIYCSDFEVEYKQGHSPLTLADRRSHAIIASRLGVCKIPILSEEGEEIPYDLRRSWHKLWIVDPLDGTRQFVKRNGEFTVNIALVENGKPVLGVIYIPVSKTLYFAACNLGAYKLNNGPIIRLLSRESPQRETAGLFQEVIDQSVKLPLQTSAGAPLTIVASHSTRSAQLDAYVEQKRLEFGTIKFFAAGGALKFCLVAEGQVDIYPKFGPTMEWDTAAGQVLTENAGAKMLRCDDQKPLVYNKPELLNPWFVVARSEKESLCRPWEPSIGENQK